MNGNLSETQKLINLDKELTQNAASQAKDVILLVQSALNEKGYDPVNQIVGYILSGDPTYITGHKNARNVIGKIERDELLEEIVTFYLENLK